MAANLMLSPPPLHIHPFFPFLRVETKIAREAPPLGLASMCSLV